MRSRQVQNEGVAANVMATLRSRPVFTEEVAQTGVGSLAALRLKFTEGLIQ